MADFWDEIKGIMDNKDNEHYAAPFWIDLTENGLAVFYIYPGESREFFTDKLIEMLGEPDESYRLDERPDAIVLLYNRQRLTPEILDLAERMTTQSQLDYLDPIKNCFGVPVDKIDDVDHALSEFNYVVVDTRKVPEVGKLVVGTLNGKPSAWRFHEWDDKSKIMGCVTSGYHALRYE